MSLRVVRTDEVQVVRRGVPGRVKVWNRGVHGRVYVAWRVLAIRLLMVALGLSATACSAASLLSLYVLDLGAMAAITGFALTATFLLAAIILDDLASLEADEPGTPEGEGRE